MAQNEEVFNDEWGEMLESLKHDHDNQGGQRKYWSPPSKEEGTFPIRILPPLKAKGEKLFYFKHNIHWIDGVPYECPNQELVDANGNLHEAEECPVCSKVKRLYKIAERDSDEWKLAGELRLQPRYVYRVIVRNKKNPEEELVPKFYETGKRIFEILFHILTETDYGIIVDPKNGRDFNITKVGTGRRANYDQSLPAANATPIFKDVEKLKTAIHAAMEMDYGSLIEFVSAENLEKKLNSYLMGDYTEEKTAKQESAKKETAVVEEDSHEEEVVDEETDEIDDILNDLNI